jgi:hypothetical protein
MNCTVKKGKTKSAQLSCVEVLHVNAGFSVKIYRNLRRNFVYGIYFNKFQVRGNLKK